jgi:hypothetical protein
MPLYSTVVWTSPRAAQASVQYCSIDTGGAVTGTGGAVTGTGGAVTGTGGAVTGTGGAVNRHWWRS